MAKIYVPILLRGNGAPASSTGYNGDYYIDDTARILYGPKASGVWGAGTSLTGPAAYGVTNQAFTQPASGANVTLSIPTYLWLVAGMVIFIEGAGYYQFVSASSATNVIVTNLGYPSNVAPATVVPTAKAVRPAGERGPTGAVGASGTQATEAVAGVAELATQAETNTGTDDLQMVTPLKLKNSTSLDIRYYTETEMDTSLAGKVGTGDARLTDTRTPTDLSVTNLKVSATAAIAESKLTLASDAVPGTASRRTLGTGAQQAVAGNDARLTSRAALTFFYGGDVATKIGVGHEAVPIACTSAEIFVNSDSAPTGGSVTVAFVKEAAGPGGTATTIGSITIAAAAKTATPVAVSTALAKNDTVRIDVTTNAGYAAASCKNLSAKLIATY